MHRRYVLLAIATWLAAGHLAAGVESADRPALVRLGWQLYCYPEPASSGGGITTATPTSGDNFSHTLQTSPSSPLEERLFAEAADGRLDEFSPLTAALVAGGIEDADSPASTGRKRPRWSTNCAREPLDGKPAKQAEAIFEFMHRQILHGGYDLGHTDLRRVLNDGRFNCVSATVLFNYLAGELGLDCRGAATPGHVISRAYVV